MKTLSLFIGLLLTVATTNLAAQTTTERKTMSEGVYEAIVLALPDLNVKQAGDLWETYTDKQYDIRTKYNRKTKEYFSDDASVAAIGKGNTFDMYAAIEEKGKGAQISVWYNLGGAYLSAKEHPDRFLEAEKMMIGFALEAAREKIRMDIAAEEKNLEQMMGDLKKLQKEKEGLEHDIEKAKEVIAQSEKGLEENAASQENKQAAIKQQEELLEAIKQKLKDF